MKTFKQYLGPEATKQQDASEIARQKKHLTDKAKEYYDQGAREGGHGAAVAKGITFDLAKKNIGETTELNEKGRCWSGHKPVPGKKPYSPGSCTKEEAELKEDLRQWFKQKWVRMDTKGNIKGQCARDPGEGKPKCLPAARAHALGKEGRASAAQRKRREDPNPERRGSPINVRTESAAAAIAAATAIAKKKSGNYDKEGFRKTPYKNPDAPNVKSNAQRRKEIKEDGMGGGAMGGVPANNVGGGNIAGSGGAGGEPGVSKKRNPIMMKLGRRNPPKV